MPHRLSGKNMRNLAYSANLACPQPSYGLAILIPQPSPECQNGRRLL
jgi:hypothetical protein